jgi:phage head maturation protease
MAITRRISADEARSLRKGELRDDGRLLKVASTAASTWDAGTRSARFVMTSETPDRLGDIIRMDGVDIAQFMRNPVAFFSHDSASWPIGKWANLQRYSHAAVPRLEGDLQLAPGGGPIATIDEAAWAIANGLTRACSIGFLPDWSAASKVINSAGDWEGGIQFNKVELLECSLVGIPANPSALAKGFGKLHAHGHHLPSHREVSQRKREIELAAIVKRGGPS